MVPEEKVFAQMLGLGPEWRIISVRFESESNLVVIEIEETSQLWSTVRCSHCQGPVKLHDHVEERDWRHLNVFQYRCEIHARLPRGRCCQCHKTFRISPPWEGLSIHFTKEFEIVALMLLKAMPVAKVGEFLGETDKRLWRMIHKHVGLAREKEDYSTVEVVACDELNSKKGHNYVTVFADLLKRKVIYATPGKDMGTWVRFAKDFKLHQGQLDKIRHVSIDLGKAYQAGAKLQCPNAKIVFDKFHVIALANKAVDITRRAEMRADPEARQLLTKQRYLLLKNPDNLCMEETDQLNEISKCNNLTAKAYQMRLTLQDIYALNDPEVAADRLNKWITWVKRTATRKGSKLAAMYKFATTIQKHLSGILSHWQGKLTNAFMEGLMSVFQATKRKARGYRTTNNLIAMLYLVAGKLQIPVRT